MAKQTSLVFCGVPFACVTFMCCLNRCLFATKQPSVHLQCTPQAPTLKVLQHLKAEV